MNAASTLCAYVSDACGDKYLFTVSDDTPEHRKRFRDHARWWMKSGYKTAPPNKQPAFPCRIVFEPNEPAN